MPLDDNDTLSTIGKHGRRVWVYPQRLLGRYLKARTLVAWLLILTMFIAPWIDVGGHAALHFDIPNRHFYVFGLTLFATDAFYLLFLFGTLVFSIFFFTAVFGRVWCAWTCPQTVFLESIIRPIEDFVEGPPSTRRRRDQESMTAGKLARKLIKWALFALVAGAITTTFLAYFLGREGVMAAQRDPLSAPVATAFFGVLTAILFFDFAWFREQTCVVVCPYGRFQSLLMDTDSLGVGYDVRRGEPRNKAKAKKPEDGDCIDCGLCVRVCPTGIDIRKGIQMECIHCMACIDACDSVMDKLGRARGLVRIASENVLAGKPRRILRPRVIAYSVALVAILTAMVVTVSGRESVRVGLTHLANAPWTELPDGRIQNMVRLRVENRSNTARIFKVERLSPETASVLTPVPVMKVGPEAVAEFPILLLKTPPVEHYSQVILRVTDDQGFSTEVNWNFLSPSGGKP